MKKKNIEPYKKSCHTKANITGTTKGYPIKRVAFHRKVNKHA